ncbi:hypothetical protein [Flocculibacter collagenilyticus]|uniref:hypothetical protein n=1 Tax=Flocculibacter collagenilyticus TaxID=2744479 RepID=UPI0018F539D7|nr:hypothetical protein [Flocculibacter collagenilyticus]
MDIALFIAVIGCLLLIVKMILSYESVDDYISIGTYGMKYEPVKMRVRRVSVHEYKLELLGGFSVSSGGYMIKLDLYDMTDCKVIKNATNSYKQHKKRKKIPEFESQFIINDNSIHHDVFYFKMWTPVHTFSLSSVELCNSEENKRLLLKATFNQKIILNAQGVSKNKKKSKRNKNNNKRKEIVRANYVLEHSFLYESKPTNKAA